MSLRRSGRCRLAFGSICVLTQFAGGLAVASESPYTSFEGREIKALSQDQIDSLQSGRGMGFALAAELNGYPGPKHVLELREELGLSQEQVHECEEIFTNMKTSAERLGDRVVEEERALDQLFASHTIDAENLARRVATIAELEGRLRTVHLRAHLEMMEILSHRQIASYIELRGYQGGEHSGHHPGAGHGGNP